MKNIFPVLILFLFQSSLAQEWEQVSSLPDTVYGRNHPITFSLNGYGYLGTGYNSKGPEELFNDFYRYDPGSDTWTEIDTFLGQKRGFGYGVTTQNKAYMGFGIGSNIDPVTNKEVDTVFNDLYSYDPNKSEWTQLASCDCIGRYHPAMVATSDKIFVGLGSSGSGNLKDWWEYDIETNTWSQKPDFPGAKRHHPYYFGIDSLVYVGFGHGSGIYKDFYEYNPRTEEWRQLSDLPDQGRVAGTQFSHGGLGYVLSGQGENHRNLVLGDFWSYNPQSDTWTKLTPHPGTGRWAPGSFIIKDTVYFNSGLADNKEHKDLWSYELPTTTLRSEYCDSLQLDSFGIVDEEILKMKARFNSPIVYDYPAFILFDENNDTVAIETIGQFSLESGESWHSLNIKKALTYPFNGYVNLYSNSYDSLECTKSINFEIELASTEPYIKRTKLKIYPNPSRDYINVQVSGSQSGEVVIRNYYGQEISRNRVQLGRHLQISLDGKPGLYIVEFRGDDNTSVVEQVIKF